MNQLEAALRRILTDMKELNAGFALIGGIAVSLRAEERTTRDIDLAITAKDDAEAEGFIRALQAKGYEAIEALEQKATGRLATVRLRPPTERSRVLVDLLFASSGIEPEVVECAESLVVLSGLEAPVARLPHLLALKVLAEDELNRLQDRLDIFSLLAEARPEELSEASMLLKLITERGFNRGKDLSASFERLQKLAQRRIG